MTSLADVALAFCRECLGWEDARILNGTQTVFEGHGGGRLGYTDLNAVMEAARGWRKDQLVWHKVTCGPGAHYVVHITKMPDDGGEHAVLGAGCNPSLCLALLAACVEASRKMKEVGC